MTDEKTREPAAVWYTHVGRQVWRAYGRHTQTLRALDAVDEHMAADTVMSDLDRLAALDAALSGASVTADDLCEVMYRARQAVESASIDRLRAGDAERERDRAFEMLAKMREQRDSSIECVEDADKLHARLCEANDKPSLRRLTMWLRHEESYTSWLGLVK